MSKVIGIDLGTTFSAIASLDDLGNPEVLASIEDNRKITASAVYLKDNEVIVGDKALNYLKDQSNNVILQTKREMENDVVWSTSKGQWIDRDGKKDVKGYTPSQISSLILSKLKDYTSGVKKAVVTVPAMFAEAARVATIDAAKLAKNSSCGLKVYSNKVPISNAVKLEIKNKKYKLFDFINAGDDYELAFSVKKKYFKNVAKIAKKYGIQVTHIGNFINEKEISIDNSFNFKGFSHL